MLTLFSIFIALKFFLEHYYLKKIYKKLIKITTNFKKMVSQTNFTKIFYTLAYYYVTYLCISMSMAQIRIGFYLINFM